MLNSRSESSNLKPHGVPVSAGMAVGRIVRFRPAPARLPAFPAGTPDEERARLATALRQAGEDLRGLRLCLSREPMFRLQLRALLRASAHGSLRIMFPMVALLSELAQARRWLEDEKHRLIESGAEVGKQIELGIMIEVPADVLAAYNSGAPL